MKKNYSFQYIIIENKTNKTQTYKIWQDKKQKNHWSST